jgi:hypothetical protein
MILQKRKFRKSLCECVIDKSKTTDERCKCSHQFDFNSNSDHTQHQNKRKKRLEVVAFFRDMTDSQALKIVLLGDSGVGKSWYTSHLSCHPSPCPHQSIRDCTFPSSPCVMLVSVNVNRYRAARAPSKCPLFEVNPLPPSHRSLTLTFSFSEYHSNSTLCRSNQHAHLHAGWMC